MRSFFARAVLFCLVSMTSTCLLTDSFGIQPAGGKNGKRVRNEIFQANVESFAQGVALFGNISGIEREIALAALAAATLAEGQLEIQPNVSYERDTVRGCVDAIRGAVPFLVANFLAERQDCPPAPATCYVDKNNLNGVALKTAFWIPLIGCDRLEQTGRIFHFFELKL